MNVNIASPGIDLPIASVMRTKYAIYPEYHTSKDDLTLVTPEGLQGGFDVLQKCLYCLENNATYQVQCLGEPQLGKRGLYPTVGIGQSVDIEVMDMLAYSDGSMSILDIAEKINKPTWQLMIILDELKISKLLIKV